MATRINKAALVHLFPMAASALSQDYFAAFLFQINQNTKGREVLILVE